MGWIKQSSSGALLRYIYKSETSDDSTSKPSLLQLICCYYHQGSQRSRDWLMLTIEFTNPVERMVHSDLVFRAAGFDRIQMPICGGGDTPDKHCLVLNVSANKLGITRIARVLIQLNHLSSFGDDPETLITTMINQLTTNLTTRLSEQMPHEDLPRLMLNGFPKFEPINIQPLEELVQRKDQEHGFCSIF